MRPHIVIMTALLVTSGCVEQHIALSRVKSALLNAGLSPGISQCMAHRMVDQLTIRQLRKLEALQGPKRSVVDYILAVQRVDDPQAIKVTVSSAALCATGLQH